MAVFLKGKVLIELQNCNQLSILCLQTNLCNMNSHHRAFSTSLLHVIIACNHLPFKKFSIFFFKFLPKFSNVLSFFEKLHACPYFLEQALHQIFFCFLVEKEKLLLGSSKQGTSSSTGFVTETKIFGNKVVVFSNCRTLAKNPKLQLTMLCLQMILCNIIFCQIFCSFLVGNGIIIMPPGILLVLKWYHSINTTKIVL